MIARKLGLGLDALLAVPVAVESPAPVSVTAAAVAAAVEPPREIALDTVRTNPQQPRTAFDEEDLAALAASIRKSGILQPVLVRPKDGGFELVAGERRLRAAKLAGLAKVPVVVRDIDDRAILQIALVENLQRRDLNPMEKARAFRQLVQMNGWTQDQAAESLGLSRPTVANFMRLLELPPEVQEAVSRGTVSMGHARALLATSNRALQLRILKDILAHDLSVRAVERLVSAQAPKPAVGRPAVKETYVQDLERRLSRFFGTRVTLHPRAKGGNMVIEWFSNDQFNGMIRKLGI